MVVNDKGRACTQRVEHKMALVEVELPPEAFDDEDWQPTPDSYLGTVLSVGLLLHLFFVHLHAFSS